MYCNTIEIYYGGKSGSMVINVDGFFPCNQKDFNKLFKLIEKDFTRSDKILDDLKQKLPERLRDEEMSTVQAAREARKTTLRIAEQENKIKNIRVEIYKGQLKDEKARLKAMKSTKYQWDRGFNTHQRNCEKLERNIKQLEEYISGR